MARSEVASEDSAERSAQAIQDVFPLPLSPFEKFVIWDERPEHPMTSFIELHFETKLDTARLENALATAVHRNPLLASRVAEREGELVWEYDPSYRPQLRIESEDPPLRDGRPIPIDLLQECGSRYWYGEREQGSRFLIQLHHACTDGVGLRRVLIDALTGYARAQQTSQADAGTSDEEPKSAKAEKIDIRLLKDRFDFSKSFSGPPSKPISTWQRIKNAHYFHFQLPEPLIGKANKGAPQPSGSAQDPCEPLRHIVLDRDVSTQIIEKAKNRSIGVNDVALAVLFQTCAKWNSSRGDAKPNSRLRVLMPYDLRSRVDLRMPATNRLSFSFLGRKHKECDDLDALIDTIHREVKDIKDSRLQMDFLGALEAGSTKPGFFKWVLGKSNRMATSVLTYTGDVSRGMKRYFPEEDGARLVGDARLKNILVAPPIRRNTNIALGLCVNWGQIGISAAWNRDAMSATECEDFLAEFKAIWEAWAKE